MAAKGLLGCLLLLALLSLSKAGLVGKILRHRRQTLAAPEEFNASVPSAGQPVVFNHVYNINVPASSLCSVSLDSPDSALLEAQEGTGHQSTEHTVDGDNQIIFTHRINIPRQACGCSDDLLGLRDLLSRLEMLEGEVSALKDQCNGERMCCGSQVTGEVAFTPYCNGHGNYSSETCSCTCEPGWRGTNCTELDCPGDCQGQGHCVNGTCQCLEGFGGENCTVEECPVGCGANGRCVAGTCVCSSGFFGGDCSQTECLNNCLRRGRCEGQVCVCDQPWTGADCSELLCPKDCLSRGRCENGTCYCDEGYAGEDCGQRTCPGKCHGNGFCVDGRCVCIAGFSGEDCSQLNCLNDCNGRGSCFNGLCICEAGYQGEDCSQLACLNNCNSRGQCINGQCSCDVGFHGEDCAELSCPNSCFNRGRCVNGQCVCEEGYAGEDCRVATCPSNCYGRGKCSEGRCACHTGFTGDDCSKLSCPNSCQNRGRCVDGQCVCNEGFAGEDCSRKACPNDCLARGHCHDGKCVCQDGYTGVDCSALSCPANCNHRGRCVNGRCACENGFEGESCEERSCLNGCRGNGRCLSGQCLCDEGYVGEDCSGVSPPTDLVVSEVTSDTVDLLWRNQMLVTEYLVTYAPTRAGGLLQEFTVSGDKTAATVHELEPGLEYIINVYAILSNKRSVPISARVATDFPRPEGVIFKSVSETSVEVRWDQLDIPFDGWEIFFRNTKEENGHIKTTVPSSQNQFVQSGLGPGQEYEIAINMVRNNTRGPQTTGTVTTKIDAPQQVEVKDVTDTSALVSWSQPVASVHRITMFYGLISDPSDTNSVEIFPPDKQYSVDGLRPDTEYKVTLISRRGDSASDPVSTSFITALDAPTNLQITSQTDQSITVQWTNSKANVSSYLVKYSPISGDGHGEELFPRQPGYSTKAALTGLRPGTEYGIGVTAVKNEAESLPATTNAETEIDPPRNVEDVESSETSLTLRWQKPQAKISTYRLVYVSRDGQVEEELIPASATSYVMSNLTPGMSYSVTLTAERGPRRSRPVSHSASTAPKPTSPERRTEEPTAMPRSSVDEATVRSALPPPTAAFMPGPGVADAELTLGNLTFTSTIISLTWSAPDLEFKSFLMEVRASSGVTHGHMTLPGKAREAEIVGLTPSTQYNITVQGLVEGRRSLPLNIFATTAEELQPAVTNLTVSDRTWDGFTVSWTPAGGDFDSFVLEITNLENLEESQNLTLSGGALSLAVSGLNPNTSYVVGLFGVYQDSVLEPVYTEATTGLPAVGKLYITNLTSDSFSILWNSSHGEFDGFVLEIIDSNWLMEPKEYNLSHLVRSYDITGLRPSTDYVAFLYGTYKSSRTNAVSTVASTAEAPDLSGLVVSNVTSDRFSLSWQTGEKHFDHFIIELRESTLPSQAMGRVVPGDGRSVVMSGLKAGTSYDIKLYGSAGGQNTQALFDLTTTEDVPQLGLLTTSSVGPHDVSLTWATLSGHFDAFVVRISDPEQQFDTQEYTLPRRARNFTVSDLVDATPYDFELYGISHDRRTPSVFAHAVTAPLPRVENMTVSQVTPHGFRVSWEVNQHLRQEDLAPSSGHFRHFHIVVTDSGWLLEPQEFSVPGNQTHLDVTGLITGIGYEVRLTGVSESGLLSRPLTTVAVTVAEPEVEHLFVSDITDGGFRLSWTSDEDMFDRFVVKIRDGKRLGHPQEYAVRGDERTMVVTGLMSGTEYEIELYGVVLDKRSQPVFGVAHTGLSTPKGLYFSDVTDSSAVVHWSTPRSAVDSYRVTYVPFEGGSPLTVTVDGGVFEALLANMIPGRKYQVTVSSVKGLEESDPSMDTVTTALDRPRTLTALNVTDTSALLLWQPCAAAVDGYVVTYSAESVPPVVEHVSGSTVEFEMGSLAPGTRYKVGVHAVKEALKSNPAVTEFTTDVDPPRDLKAINIQTDGATLTWKPPQAAVTGYTLTFTAGGVIREVVLSPTASSYTMAQLAGSTEYNIRLQAIAGAQRSRHVDAVFMTNGQLFARPRDCAQIRLNGEAVSGLFSIYVGGEENQPLQVWCDMTTDGGGWMVFLRRQSGKLDFFRNWKNYTAGFGNMNDEFWLGLSNLHKITSSGLYELRVDLRDSGESAFAQYDKFVVAEPRTRYKLYIGAYSGTAGDSMTYHQGRPFSTYDNDNDIAVTNCALSYKGAFWYKNCHRVNLMGKYGDKSHSKGINWFHWRGHEHSIEFAEMKLRPADFKQPESRRKRS